MAKAFYNGGMSAMDAMMSYPNVRSAFLNCGHAQYRWLVALVFPALDPSVDGRTG